MHCQDWEPTHILEIFSYVYKTQLKFDVPRTSYLKIWLSNFLIANVPRRYTTVIAVSFPVVQATQSRRSIDTMLMFCNFNHRHIPALYFGSANCLGAILIPLCGTRSVIQVYGLAPRNATLSETWPVFQANRGRLSLLRVLMYVFYW